ncbi:hypothetical protein KJ616_02615 [Patescibacteria group bacterium]|nr:hypothetical protein [Patescibacteria group bacterium]
MEFNHLYPRKEKYNPSEIGSKVSFGSTKYVMMESEKSDEIDSQLNLILSIAVFIISLLLAFLLHYILCYYRLFFWGRFFLFEALILLFLKLELFLVLFRLFQTF